MKVYICKGDFDKLEKMGKLESLIVWRDPLKTPYHVLKIKKIKTVHHYSFGSKPSLKNRIKDAWAVFKNKE